MKDKKEIIKEFFENSEIFKSQNQFTFDICNNGIRMIFILTIDKNDYDAYLTIITEENGERRFSLENKPMRQSIFLADLNCLTPNPKLDDKFISPNNIFKNISDSKFKYEYLIIEEHGDINMILTIENSYANLIIHFLDEDNANIRILLASMKDNITDILLVIAFETIINDNLL